MYTVFNIRNGFADMLAGLRYSESTPPLYFALAWAWARVFGMNEVGLRSLSALAGTATIPVGYLTAKRLVSPRAGLAAAAIIAVNPMLVWLSLDARAYVFSVLLGSLSFYFFVRHLDDGSSRSLLGWVITSILAFFNRYFAVFLVGGETLWLLAFARSRRAVVSATALIALGGLIALPLALIHMDRSMFIERLPWWPRLLQVPPTFVVGFQPPWQVATAGLGCVLVMVAVVVLWLRGSTVERRGAGIAAVISVASIVLPIAASLLPGTDFLLARNYVAATVPLIVVIAAGFAAMRGGTVAKAAFAAYLALSVMIDLTTAHVSKFEHEDWRGAAAAIGNDDVARAIVLTPPSGTAAFLLYRPRVRHAPSTGGSVEEIDVCALPPPFRRIGEPSRPPRLPPDTPLPPGFELAEVVETSSFTLARYRAPQPRHFKRVDLARFALRPPASHGGGMAVLLEGVP